MGMFSRKSGTEQHAEAQGQGQSAKKLTPKQQVAAQCRASDLKNKRRGR